MEHPLRTTLYGQKKSHVDCVLFCLHGDDGAAFLEAFPLFETLYEHDPESLHHFLSIEQDVGSTELSHAIASSLVTQKKHLAVRVIEVCIPRGILDLGRHTAERGIRPLFHTHEHLDLTESLRQLHIRTMTELHTVFDDLSTSGFWLDIHTMAPHDPHTSKVHHGPDPLIPVPHALRPYIEAYTEGVAGRTIRPMNIATEVSESPGKLLADQTPVAALQSHLGNAGFSFAQNCPHPMTLAITAADFMSRYGRGSFIDVPKHMLTRSSAQDVSANLHDVALDEEAIQRVAETIAGAFVEVLG